jgi:Kef-type K+ transport system membrane component KefB
MLKHLKINKMENFAKFMILVLATIISPIINGFVFSKLWFWFIVPTFQMQPLRIVESIGIIFLINFICMKRDKDADNDQFWKTFIANITFIVLMAGFTLVSGWIVTLFL